VFSELHVVAQLLVFFMRSVCNFCCETNYALVLLLHCHHLPLDVTTSWCYVRAGIDLVLPPTAESK